MPGGKWKSPLVDWDVYNQDPNLAFTLIARNERARQMWADPHNSSRYVPSTFRRNDPKDQTDNTQPGIEIKEETEPALQFLLNEWPKNLAKGFVFGTDDKACDVLLGDPSDSFSEQMLALTFNEQHELIMNVTSDNTTSVTFNDQIQAGRQRFSWIFPQYQKMIRVKVANLLEFDVVLPKYGINEEKFHRNCEVFRACGNQLPDIHDITSTAATIQTSDAESPWDPFYLLGQKLGNGSYGDVFKALRMPDGKTFAAKSFKHNVSSFRREVNNLKKVCEVPHKYITQFVEEWHGDNEPLLIMEYVAGGTLKQRMRSEMETGEITNLANQMLAALVFLHDQKIMHRDIKPANILCVTPSHYKLADFGVAKEVAPLLSMQGTHPYMAPEVLVLAPYSFSADIWSLGVVLFECMADHLPAGCPELEGRKWCEKIYKKLTVVLRECEELLDMKEGDAVQIIHLVQKAMLHLDPEERWSARKCLDFYPHLWEGLVSGEDSGPGSGVMTPTKGHPNGPQVPKALESLGDDDAGEAGSSTVRGSGGGALVEGRVPQKFRNEDRSTVARHATVELPSLRGNLFPSIPSLGESIDGREFYDRSTGIRGGTILPNPSFYVRGTPYDPAAVVPDLSFVSDDGAQEHSIPE